MTVHEEALHERHPDHAIEPSIVGRWSPRAMTGEILTEEQLLQLFEAARWAPSSYNNQPWRFVYARREEPHWDSFFTLLNEFNQTWAKNAAVLVVFLSKNTFDHNGKFSRTHSFDTGAAWQNLALQASAMNLVAHGMEGFDYERAAQLVGATQDYTVEAMIAIGWFSTKETLPESLQEREEPSRRKPLSEIAFKGSLSL